MGQQESKATVPETQIADLSSFPVSTQTQRAELGDTDARKLIRVTQVTHDQQAHNPLLQQLHALPPVPPHLLPQSWHLPPEPLNELLAKVQTYGLKSGILIARRQETIMAKMRDSQLMLAKLSSKIAQRQDQVRRVEARLSETPRLAEDVQAASEQIKELVGLVSAINALMPPQGEDKPVNS
eukprot:NODE_5306_length_673_cov_11.265568_g5143_i0.p1 GENE.NODE_5306_length_673_cov_11.265568_g5143_i0~~NODE_5306_length_673_cov_11.265568_g5143_i0.p1  ORF type:complete len:182 (-),score=51.95 NODE_5306_length_673_cov_11.265568_g5143_i0:64-609(-)